MTLPVGHCRVQQVSTLNLNVFITDPSADARAPGSYGAEMLNGLFHGGGLGGGPAVARCVFQQPAWKLPLKKAVWASSSLRRRGAHAPEVRTPATLGRSFGLRRDGSFRPAVPPDKRVL